jgi:antitoxin component YwqK of YwqJK toxin-antitoxin module
VRAVFAALLVASLLSACRREGDQAPPENVEVREARYDNGQIKERVEVVQTPSGSYERHGKFTFYHSNGQKQEEGSFAKDELSGEWMAWHENGKVRSKGKYENGERVGEFIDYGDDGVMQAKGTYNGGKQDGEFVKYDPNGAPTLKLTWSQGELAGPISSYMGGKEIVTGGFKQGKAHGKWVVKDAAGRQLGTVTMADGEYRGSVRSSPPAPEVTPSCPSLFGFHFGKSTYADVKLGFLKTGLVPPETALAKSAGVGRMIVLDGEEYGLQNVAVASLAFDGRGLFVAARLTMPKGDKSLEGHRANFERLFAELRSSARVVKKKFPFVGDSSAKLASEHCEVYLDAPHLSFSMTAEYWLKGHEAAVKALP